MEKPRPIIPHQFSSSQVLLRFGVRFALLAVFAAFTNQGFRTTLATLLPLCAFFCALMGTLRHEAILGPVLTHWDEAAAYAVMGRVTSALS
jgi:hypothetical protein